MKFKYLNLFRLSRFDWSITSSLANDRLYAPSLSELHYYCEGKEYTKCPVLLKMGCAERDTHCSEVAFVGQSY